MVTAAEVLSVAAFIEGKHAQAFPSFGSERMGAPVMAFCRIDDRAIRLREPVVHPHALIIQDSTLLTQVDLFSGLREEGFILINSMQSFEELGIGEFVKKFPGHHVCTLPAAEIARKHLGKPLPNAVMLGGFAAMTRQVKLQSVQEALRERFSDPLGEKNAGAAAEAYAAVEKKLPNRTA